MSDLYAAYESAMARAFETRKAADFDAFIVARNAWVLSLPPQDVPARVVLPRYTGPRVQPRPEPTTIERRSSSAVMVPLVVPIFSYVDTSTS